MASKEEFESLSTVLVIAHDAGDIDDEELLLLLLALEEDMLQPSHVLPPRLCLRSLDDHTCKLRFRFSSAEIMELCHALRIPEKMVGPSRVSWTGLEGLLVVLRRLSYPCRLGELSDEFGRSLPDLSRIFNSTLMWIWRRWSGQVQDPFTKAHFTPARLRAYRAAIYRKSGVDLRVWGFIDGTVRPMCRPREHQRMFYNGHKRVHALKFQAVTTPDGLICHLYGPVVGSRHDAGVHAESGLLPQLQQHMQLPAGPPYALFGDPAYPLSPYLQKAYAGAALTQQQTTFNTDMAAVRQSVEWSFGDITVMWAFVDFRKNLKIGLQPLALYYMVAALLTNCHTILRGNKTSKYFDVPPPGLLEYFQ